MSGADLDPGLDVDALTLAQQMRVYAAVGGAMTFKPEALVSIATLLEEADSDAAFALATLEQARVRLIEARFLYRSCGILCAAMVAWSCVALVLS